MRTILTMILAVMTLIPAGAYKYVYSFNNTPISEAIVRISKDNPDVNISFIYKELDNYHTSARIATDDVFTALSQTIGLNPISIVKKNRGYYIEAFQHGEFCYNGRVIGSNDEPVVAATVMLLAPKDSAMITYGLTNTDGYFSVPCDIRDVIVKVSCLGYHTVIRRCHNPCLGIVTMSENPTILRELSVTASAPFVKTKGTGLSIDIENSPLCDMPTVPDILSQLPAVKATDSGFSVMGRGDAMIYIDNRKITNLSELYRLRPAQIRAVEIIRNPGAEFDADAAAVIRIYLKKSVLKGLGVDVMTQGGMGRRFSDYEQLSITYGAGSTNSFLTFSNNSSRLNSDQDNYQDTYTPSGVWRMSSDMPHWRSEYYDWTLAAGSSVIIADRHTAGVKVTYSNDTQRNAGYKYSDMTVNGLRYEDLTANTSNPQGYRQWHTNLYYEGALSEKCNLTFNGDYVNRNYRSVHYTDESGSLTPQHTVINTDRAGYSLWSGLLKASWKTDDNSQIVFGTDISIVNQDRNNSQNDTEQISSLKSIDSKYALFGQWHLSHNIWNFDAGLRYEADNMNYADGISGNLLLNRTYHRFYPDITVSAHFGKTTMSVGFSSRIKRPTFYQLRTSHEYFNRYETTEGNPLLRPRYTYDISYSMGYENLTISAGYQWIYNSITEESRIDADNPLHLTSYPINKSKYTAVSLQLNYNHKFGIWCPYVSAQLTKTFYGISLQDNMPAFGKTPLLDVQFSNYFLFYGTTAYVIMNFNPAGAYCNSWEGRYIGVDLGAYRRFFNKRLYVAVTATNILGSTTESRTYYGASIFKRTAFRDNQRVCLTVSYIFRHENKYRGKTSAQDEINRM